jgi:hypothetical protein
VEDVGAALVEDDGAVALRRDVPAGPWGEDAAQAVGGEGSPDVPREGRHPAPRRLLLAQVFPCILIRIPSPWGDGDVLELFSGPGVWATRRGTFCCCSRRKAAE